MTVSGLLKPVPTIGCARRSARRWLRYSVLASLSPPSSRTAASRKDRFSRCVTSSTSRPAIAPRSRAGRSSRKYDWEGPPPRLVAARRCLQRRPRRTADEGGVEQTFDTIPGETYEVTFSLAGNFGLPVIKPLAVTVAGDTHNFTFDSTGASSSTCTGRSRASRSWPRQRARRRAVSDLTGIGSNAGAVIDAVSIELASAQRDHRFSVSQACWQSRSASSRWESSGAGVAPTLKPRFTSAAVSATGAGLRLLAT